MAGQIHDPGDMCGNLHMKSITLLRGRQTMYREWLLLEVQYLLEKLER